MVEKPVWVVVKVSGEYESIYGLWSWMPVWVVVRVRGEYESVYGLWYWMPVWVVGHGQT
jgi:hypothetical protein